MSFRILLPSSKRGARHRPAYLGAALRSALPRRCPWHNFIASCLSDTSSSNYTRRADNADATELENQLDVVILSNGPGEVAAWVRPTVRALRQEHEGETSRLKISVILVPCPHASGKEAAVVRSYPEVDDCQEPEHLSSLLLTGRPAFPGRFASRGVVLFLGGDQLTAILLGKRLGYPTLLYAEADVLWPQFSNRYLLRQPGLLQKVPPPLQSRCRVVGDLFMAAVAAGDDGNADLRHSDNEQPSGAGPRLPQAPAPSREQRALQGMQRAPVGTDAANVRTPVVGLLPGSKPAKLAIGLPFFIAAAEQLAQRCPDVRFVLPVAPTVTVEMLAEYACPSTNQYIEQFGWGRAAPAPPEDPQRLPELRTGGGARIELWTRAPAYDLFEQCDVCLTTVGTNTAELGALGVPMVVVLPTQALDVFRGAAGGLAGLATQLPGPVGAAAARAVNRALLAANPVLAWPNMWAEPGREVVPELVGPLEVAEVVDVLESLVVDEGKRTAMSAELRALGNPNAESSGSTREGNYGDGAAEIIASECFSYLS
ncbi:hypothetical protein CYMTET_31184 [Cymbomonas tetramitiformis]|uniref:Lipid-A-disaccharide synthase n=1 Tax=Cymbomonas tetramitiformis TaxID=36881 RepID=A0AAE0FHQ9_9CHLO|nr:hypothetical protein CYMTET_31184 [Cymbomonas tetramitiformis]